MVQTSILGRMGQLVRANVNAILDSAEDPEKMLNQMVLDYTNNIREAEQAVAQTIGNLRLLEDDAKEARAAAGEWGGKALAASRRADGFRAAGNAADADRFDGLAKIALKRQISFEEQTRTFDEQIATQAVLVGKLKDGLNAMRAKREELVQKKSELIARSKMARAQTKVTMTMKSVNLMDPTSEVSRFEEKIRQEEAKARGLAEVASSSLDAQFASLDDSTDDLEVEARLASLKGSGG
ncbi:MAG TPA: PspA/IM30 family protein [Patescibacteria group bacterium]|nr:PspA/IM30 family protein [Patescibacteria group bacterium]